MMQLRCSLAALLRLILAALPRLFFAASLRLVLQLRCGYSCGCAAVILAGALRYSVKCKKEDGSILMHPLFGYLIAVGLVYYDFIYEDECFAVLGVDSDVAGLAVAG